MKQTDCPNCRYPGGLDEVACACAWEDGNLVFFYYAVCFACEQEFRMRALWGMEDLKFGGIGWS